MSAADVGALIDNGSATDAQKTWPGGYGYFAVAGTFGGATVSLQLLGADGSTWATVGSLTAAGGTAYHLPPGQIRALVAGGSPSGLYARFDPIRSNGSSLNPAILSDPTNSTAIAAAALAGVTAGTTGYKIGGQSRYLFDHDATAIDPTSKGWNIGVQTFDVNGQGVRPDTVWSMGYNMLCGNGRRDTSDASLGISMESYYVQGGVTAFEFHLTSWDTSGNEHRFFTAFLPRNGGTGSSLELAGDQLLFKKYDGSLQMQWIWSTGLFIYNSIAFKFDVNNTAVQKQKNAAGSSYLSFPYFGSDDRLSASSSMSIVGPTPTTGAYANAFMVIQPTSATGNGTAVSIAGPAVTGQYDALNAAVSCTNALRNYLYNQGGTGNSHAQFYAFTLGGGGNPMMTFEVNGTAWSIGSDNANAKRFKISQGSNVGVNDAFMVDTNLNVFVGGNASALATSATNGFLFIPTSAGAPTGVPAGYNAGATVALCYDKTNHKLYAYDGAWKSTAALA